MSQAINSINVEQASESDMIKQKSQGWGREAGKRQKSIFVVNASKTSAELLDKDITLLASRLFVFLFLPVEPLCEMYRHCQPEEQLLFRITGLKQSESFGPQRQRLVKAISLVREQQNPAMLLTHPPI